MERLREIIAEIVDTHYPEYRNGSLPEYTKIFEYIANTGKDGLRFVNMVESYYNMDMARNKTKELINSITR